MSIPKLFLWILVFLLLYKAVKFIGAILSGSNNNSKAGHQVRYRSNQRQSINKEDVIEADFEEIEDTKTREGK